MNYGIGNVKDKSKSLFTTTTAPTESGGVITLATTDIVESGFKIGDYLAYVDSDNISALYSISAISSGTATLSLIGNVGGGKQLYQHILKISITGMANQYVSIINDSNDAFDFTALKNYLNTNNFSSGLYLPIISSGDGTGVGLYYDGGSSIYLKTPTGNTAFGNASISDRRIAL